MPEHGRFPPRCGGPCTIGMGAAASRGATSGSARRIMCGTGRREARRHCRIWHCSAGAIIGRCTRKATGSSDSRTVRYASGGRMGDPCPRCQCRRRCPRTRHRRCGHGTWRRDCGFTGARDSRAGSGSGSTWAGRSTCCTQGRGTMRLSASRFAQRRSPRPHPIPDRPASGAGRPAWCPSSAPKGDAVSEPYRAEAGVSFAIGFSAMPWKIFRPRLNIATDCSIA